MSIKNKIKFIYNVLIKNKNMEGEIPSFFYPLLQGILYNCVELEKKGCNEITVSFHGKTLQGKEINILRLINIATDE